MTKSTDILLVTINAKYHHASFGLRYLMANLKDLAPQASILEFTLAQNPRDIAESILNHNPRIVGFGVYIWNTDQTQAVVSVIKKLSPETVVVLGGPEVSFEIEPQLLFQTADYVIKGEADFLFYDFCRNYIFDNARPENKIISGELPDIGKITAPYSLYSDNDIKNRYLYVEASRGCPYKCEYCLSSLDKSVRNFPIDGFLADMDSLITRGARQFKFVDRTFNLSVPISSRILRFFLDRISLGLFLHFEMVPDRLPAELRDLIRQFPAGSLQFEIGIQTWNPEVSANVSRRQDYTKIRENFRFLTEETGVHIHADLIVGLPGETLESFALGFDNLAALRPHEIQVGILKRLKGTPIMRHDQIFKMLYQDHPPFQILRTSTMDFSTIQSMGRFAHFWNLYANSGNFKGTVDLFRRITSHTPEKSLFWLVYKFSTFLHIRHPQGHGVALANLVESAWIFLTQHLQVAPEVARDVLMQDYNCPVKRDIPAFLRTTIGLVADTPKLKSHSENPIPKRQRRHLKPNIESTESPYPPATSSNLN